MHANYIGIFNQHILSGSTVLRVDLLLPVVLEPVLLQLALLHYSNKTSDDGKRVKLILKH